MVGEDESCFKQLLFLRPLAHASFTKHNTLNIIQIANQSYMDDVKEVTAIKGSRGPGQDPLPLNDGVVICFTKF